MPGFIKTPADEKKWQAIKHSVAKQRGKSVEDFTDRDWATVNAAWHKSEGNLDKFEEILKSLTSVPRISSGMKMPKPKSMPQALDKPSKFFKSETEEFEHMKHPTLMKLRDFLKHTHGKKIK